MEDTIFAIVGFLFCIIGTILFFYLLYLFGKFLYWLFVKKMKMNPWGFFAPVLIIAGIAHLATKNSNNDDDEEDEDDEEESSSNESTSYEIQWRNKDLPAWRTWWSTSSESSAENRYDYFVQNEAEKLKAVRTRLIQRNGKRISVLASGQM